MKYQYDTVQKKPKFLDKNEIKVIESRYEWY